jgi:hypothetical protein
VVVIILYASHYPIVKKCKIVDRCTVFKIEKVKKGKKNASLLPLKNLNRFPENPEIAIQPYSEYFSIIMQMNATINLECLLQTFRIMFWTASKSKMFFLMLERPLS